MAKSTTKVVEDPAEEGRRQRRLARAAKQEAVEFEQTNTSAIFLYTSTHGWWKMGGRSALIYVHRLAPRITGLRQPKILNDSDFSLRFKQGVVAIKDVERLEKNLNSMGVVLSEEMPTHKIYKLPFKVTKAELDRLTKLELARKERINQIVIPENLYPDIYVHIVDIHKMVRHMVAKMVHVDLELYGKPLLFEVQQASVEYKILANGEVELVPGLEGLLMRSRQMLYRLHDLVDLGIEAPEKRAEMARKMSELKRILGAELRKVERGRQNTTA